MKKNLCLTTIFFLLTSVYGQTIKLKFEITDTSYFKKIYIIDVTSLGDLTVGASHNLIDSVPIVNNSATINFKGYKKHGFYRIQCVPLTSAPYGFSTKRKASFYYFNSGSVTDKTIINFESSKIFRIIDCSSNNKEQKQFFTEQSSINIVKDSLMNEVKKNNLDREKFVIALLKLFKNNYVFSKSDFTKLYIGQQIIDAKAVLDSATYNSIIDFDYSFIPKAKGVSIRIYNDFMKYVQYKRDISIKKLISCIYLDFDGKPFNLRTDENKITILDFWASYCNPCRYENKTTFQTLQKKYNNNVVIVSISFDTEISKWKKAISVDNMIWRQIIVPKGPFSDVYKLIEVEKIGIPQNLVVYKGEIVGENMRGSFLIDFIEKFITKHK